MPPHVADGAVEGGSCAGAEAVQAVTKCYLCSFPLPVESERKFWKKFWKKIYSERKKENYPGIISSYVPRPPGCR